MLSSMALALLLLSSPFAHALSSSASFRGPATLGRPINPKIAPLRESPYETRVSTRHDASDPSLVSALLRCAYTVEREKGQLNLNELTTRLFPTAINSPIIGFLGQARALQKDMAEGKVVLAMDKSDAVCAFGHMRSGGEEPEGVAVVRTYVPEKLKKKGVAGAAIINAAEIWACEDGCSTLRLEIDKKRASDKALVAFFIGAAGHAISGL